MYFSNVVVTMPMLCYTMRKVLRNHLRLDQFQQLHLKWYSIYFECLNVLQSIEHDEVCNGGIARMSIRTGDIRRYYVHIKLSSMLRLFICMNYYHRGVGIAQSMSSKQLKRDCASILESLKVNVHIKIFRFVYLRTCTLHTLSYMLSQVFCMKIHSAGIKQLLFILRQRTG